MNCDQAFDYLTDSDHRHDDALRRHLDACPRCRQMQETLQPALTLFDPVPTADRCDADRWDEDVLAQNEPSRSTRQAADDDLSFAAAVRIAEQAAQRLTDASPRRRVVLSVLRYAAAFLVGALVAFSAAQFPMQRESGRSGVPGVPTASACEWQLRYRGAKLVEGSSHAIVVGCVGCHLGTGGDPQPATPGLRAAAQPVIMSCVACHLSSSADDRTNGRSNLNPRGATTSEDIATSLGPFPFASCLWPNGRES